MLLHALVPEPPVDGFDVRILIPFAGFDQTQRHAALVRPREDGASAELGTVGWSDDTIRRLIGRKIIKAVVLPQANPKKRTHRRIRIPESEVARSVRLYSNV